MKLSLNGALFGNACQFHNYLANQLHFPAWYGRNLDALYDCLTDLTADTELELLNWPQSGTLARAKRAMQDAAAENAHLKISVAE